MAVRAFPVWRCSPCSLLVQPPPGVEASLGRPSRRLLRGAPPRGHASRVGVPSLGVGVAFAADVGVAPAEPATFLSEVAAIPPPAALPLLLSLLHTQGYAATDPWDRKGILPLLIPIAQKTDAGGRQRLALLRWPTPPEGLEVPLLSIEEDGTLHLRARSAVEYINRALAEEDAAGSGEKPVAAAVEGALAALAEGRGAVEGKLYQAGDFAASKLPRVEAFITRKVGPFPDVMERLALNHLDAGDVVSALVTGEFYASRKHFPGFGRPFMFNAELLKRVGRAPEARDAARIALRSPWWTLGGPYQEAAELAGYGDTLLEFAKERISDEGRKADLQKGKSPAQVALDQAAFLMDVAAVDNSWDEIRSRLASLYEESGLQEIADFVRIA